MSDDKTASGEIDAAPELERQHPESTKAALDETAESRQALSNAAGDPRPATIADAAGSEESVTIAAGPEPDPLPPTPGPSAHLDAMASGDAGARLELVRRGILAIAGKVGLEESRLGQHHEAAKMSIGDVIGIVRGVGDVARAVAGLVGGDDVEPVDPAAVARRIDALEDELAKNNAAIDAAADAKFGPG